MLTLTLLVSLIAGATMAWFTGFADAGDTLFQTGTVKVKLVETGVLGDKTLDNVNPGDCYVLQWKIKNDGTKRFQLRTELDFGWKDNTLENDNIYIVPAPRNEEYVYDWVLYQEAENKPVYAYLRGYPDGILPGEKVELWLIVYFDDDSTENPYQGQKFILGGTIEAVQASNEVPSTAWGNAWDDINKSDYSFGYAFWDEKWRDFDPMDVKCYEKLTTDDDEQYEPENPGDEEDDDNNNGNDEPDQSAHDVGSFTIILNGTKVKKGEVTFHIHDLKDTSGNEIGSVNKDIYYNIYINDKPVYDEDQHMNAYFNGGGNCNNITVENISIPNEDDLKWKVIVTIDGITVISEEKDLN